MGNGFSPLCCIQIWTNPVDDVTQRERPPRVEACQCLRDVRRGHFLGPKKMHRSVTTKIL